MSIPPLVLHATPPLGDLPASDSESLYLAAYFQLACPGRWAISTSQWGDNGGKLPFITHLGHHIRRSHLNNLPLIQDPDESLSREEKVDADCWRAYIEQNLVDLVNHTYYSLPPNYPDLLAKEQFKHLKFPESQYIPQRVRSIVRSRLQHVGLWGLGGLNSGDAADEDRQRLDEAFVVGPAGTLAPRAWSGWTAGRDMEERRKKWGEQELEKKIKGVLDPIVRRLGDKLYFFGDRPTTLDVALFAQLTFVLTPTLPNPLLPNLIRTAYPSLLSHHDRLLSLLFSDSWSSAPRTTAPPRSEQSYLESITSFISSPFSSSSPPKTGNGQKKEKKSDQEKRFERGRWLWFTGATVAMIGYLITSGMIKIEFGSGDDEEDSDTIDEEVATAGEEEVIFVEEEVGNTE
ncbi:uncharacterized protein I303_104804 [Kwoniella dejecticola CBS 10117]|uniref:GST C-terminal domain-containing protein n=1 Tax=Kwoniella dejecticola CBS 10117 TaxID=1296121 RepID=A0A1A6A4C5_9TREE|nr:uncharacterized protein I303_04215 [Kwoniella dejecticola CBS 10117]OBR84893.1 hypothetical protein I303_04215 [Kwoniella dejecticola CBS 10117]